MILAILRYTNTLGSRHPASVISSTTPWGTPKGTTGRSRITFEISLLDLFYNIFGEYCDAQTPPKWWLAIEEDEGPGELHPLPPRTPQKFRPEEL